MNGGRATEFFGIGSAETNPAPDDPLDATNLDSIEIALRQISCKTDE